MEADRDWGAWSDGAFELMRRRNDGWQKQYRLRDDSPFSWSLVPPELVFDRGDDEVAAKLCVVGSEADIEGTFIWAWANANIPDEAKVGLDVVRRFGTNNGLTMLTEPTTGGLDGEECLAIAGRLLNSDGVFIARQGDVTLFFALSNFRLRSRAGHEPDGVRR
jgi:hypothetical protein